MLKNMCRSEFIVQIVLLVSVVMSVETIGECHGVHI